MRTSLRGISVNVQTKFPYHFVEIYVSVKKIQKNEATHCHNERRIIYKCPIFLTGYVGT